jgi:hypothetical protein
MPFSAFPTILKIEAQSKRTYELEYSDNTELQQRVVQTILSLVAARNKAQFQSDVLLFIVEKFSSTRTTKENRYLTFNAPTI